MTEIVVEAFGAMCAALVLASLVQPRAVAWLCIAGFLAAAIHLAALSPGLVIVPVGVVRGTTALALDPLADLALMALCLAAAAVGRRSSLVGVILAADILTVLAGDAPTLALGFGVSSILAWLTLRGPAVAPGLAGVLVVGALSLWLVGEAGSDMRFATLRTIPPDGWRVAVAWALIVAAAAARMLAPVASGATRTDAGATLVGTSGTTGLYLLLRVLFDVAGPATPAWWGLPLLVVGAAAACVAAIRALSAEEIGGVVVASAVQWGSMMIAGLGAALVARAADLAPLSGFALAGTLLVGLTQAAIVPLGILGVGAIAAGAGTRHFDRLGGLALSMPMTARVLAVVALSAAALPPGPGFAGLWMVMQSIIAAFRIGGLAQQAVLAGALALLAVASGLGAAAWARVLGIALLGRPRTPRAAAAEEGSRAMGRTMAVLAIAAIMVGIVPTLALAVVGPAVDALILNGAGFGRLAISVAVQADMPGYDAAITAGLLVLACCAALALMRPTRVARGRGWDGGFARPPAWLPFGDPATQAAAASLPAMVIPVVPRRPRRAWLGAIPRGAVAACLAMVLIAMMVGLSQAGP